MIRSTYSMLIQDENHITLNSIPLTTPAFNQEKLEAFAVERQL